MRPRISKRLHLDFHNHRLVKGIGSGITVEGFKRDIEELGIDSIVLFAKCHHGLSYYPTSVGKIHPGMDGDLLGTQVEACESAGVDYHLYFSVLRENYAFDNYPQWRWIGPDGSSSSPEGEYRLVCINTGYYDDYLKPQIIEAVTRYPGSSGAWLDIIRYKGNACYCAECTEDASRLGISPQEFNKQMLLEKYEDIQRTLRDMGKELTLNTIVFLGNEDWRSLTPLEIESILAHVGPFHFPLFSRYLNRYQCERYGITHSFHQNWREYGTCKHPVQIGYEACQMAFAGFGVSLGDQLEPDGTFEPRRFHVLKTGYELADRLSDICDLSLSPVMEAAVVVSGSEGAQEDGQSAGRQDNFVRGTLKYLIETHYQVQVIDPGEDFSPYKLMMLPAVSLESEAFRQRLEEYLNAGGKAVVMGSAGAKGLKWLGLERENVGNAGYQFMVTPTGEKHLVRSRGEIFRSNGNLRSIMTSYLPYGDTELEERERECLRPEDPETAFASVFENADGTLIYSSADVLTDYYHRGDWAHREIMREFLDTIDVQPAVTGDVPSSVEVSIYGDDNTTEIRALDYTMKRENVGFAQQTEYDLTRSYRFEIECAHPVTRVVDCVNSRDIEFTQINDRIIVQVDSSEPYVVVRIS